MLSEYLLLLAVRTPPHFPWVIECELWTETRNRDKNSTVIVSPILFNQASSLRYTYTHTTTTVYSLKFITLLATTTVYSSKFITQSNSYPNQTQKKICTQLWVKVTPNTIPRPPYHLQATPLTSAACGALGWWGASVFPLRCWNRPAIGRNTVSGDPGTAELVIWHWRTLPC